MLKKFGPMRLFLIVVASALIIAAFFTEMMVANNRAMLYVMATMVPIMMFVILFDVMMNRIQIADKKEQPELQHQYRINGRIELLFTIVMVLVWLPFFKNLL